MIQNKSISVCIPARYQSSRLPGKPLALIAEKPMILRVLENMSNSKYADNVIVLTDDQRIMEVIQNAGHKAMMTSESHQSGTDRIIEYSKSNSYDYYFNVQGDEPLVTGENIDYFISQTIESQSGLSTPITQITDDSDLFDYSKVKCVFDINRFAIYFSRQAIPSQRDIPYRNWLEKSKYYKHIGIYGFSNLALKQISDFTIGKLELVEQLEQLRWLENCLKIYCIEMNINNISVDTVEDLETINEYFKNNVKK